ncbi:MAG: L,D-transpeptidase [Thermomicrobiales bacterium]
MPRENRAAAPATRRVGRAGVAAVFAALSLVLTMFLPMMPQASADDWSAPRTVYIPETGHTLDQLFLDMWRGSGGAAAYGNPITSEITQKNGHVVQYLEYARFEYWPEGDANGNTVFAANIGQELQPIAIHRSVAGLSTPKKDGAASEATRFQQAWLPVKATDSILASDTILYVSATKHTVADDFWSYWDSIGGANYLGNPLTEQYTLKGVTYQVFEKGQIAKAKDGTMSLVPVGKLLADKYKLDQKPVAQGDIPTYDEALFIAPEPAKPEIANATDAPTGGLWVDVNLSSQYMVVYQGNTPVMESYVSTGREGFDTPTGTFSVLSMLPSQTMEGVLGGEYYNVPDVPDVMYFTEGGHALHGTYWHNNFGSVMSHGCVNLPMDVADWLYANAYIGMPVVIHY